MKSVLYQQLEREERMLKLYQMKAMLDGVNMMEVYLEDKYVSFGWEELGNLEPISLQQLIIKRQVELQATERAQLPWLDQWEEIQTFVYEMQDGDYVIVVNGDIAHIGDLGDYYYVQGLETAEINSCHRRGVTWLKSVAIEQLAPQLQSFVKQSVNISAFDQPVSKELIEQWSSGVQQPNGTSIEAALVPEEMLAEALTILQAAMRSDDAERRERAAIAILQYAKRG